MGLVKVYNSKESINELGKIKTVVMAGNGTFEKRSSWLGRSIKKVSNYGIKTFPEMEETVEEIFENTEYAKIPFEAIKIVMKWYKNITEKTSEEAQINFYRMKDKDYLMIDEEKIFLKDIPGINFWNDNIFSYVPLQRNSSIDTSVSKKDKYYDELNKQFGLYMETHSHNSMNAFRSVVDKEYSYNDGIQLVFGQLKSKTIEMYSWLTVREVQKAGLYPNELNSFVELNGDFYKHTKKFMFSAEILDDVDFDFSLWDNQIEVPIPKKPDYNYESNLNFYEDEDYFDETEDEEYDSYKEIYNNQLSFFDNRKTHFNFRALYKDRNIDKRFLDMFDYMLETLNSQQGVYISRANLSSLYDKMVKYAEDKLS